MFKNILGKDGFVKAFYARIKEYSGTIIDRVFITGVCSISLDSMTSGFNIATNITTDFRFNAMTAFTNEEVKKMLKETNNDKYFKEMVEYYGGYKFSDEAEEKVFNPTLAMYYINSLLQIGEPPEQLFDSNFASGYRKIKDIISQGNYKEILDNIYSKEGIISRIIVNFSGYSKYHTTEIVSLLFYFGYLTIEKESLIALYSFTIPNRVIENEYNKCYMDILRESNIIRITKTESEAVDEIVNEGKIDKLCNYISNLLKNADNRLYINFKEKDLQILIYLILSRYQRIDAYMEYPVNDNYIDIFIKENEYNKHNIMIELKYLKKKESNLSDSVMKEAIKQVGSYTYDKEINMP